MKKEIFEHRERSCVHCGTLTDLEDLVEVDGIEYADPVLRLFPRTADMHPMWRIG